MSHNELVDAYRRGKISRRTFVRGMVALGATVTMAERAATAYAAPQNPARSASLRAQGDVYGGEDDGGTGGRSSGGSSSGGSKLPRTGSGPAAAGSWLKPATLVAGAAALAVAGLRRLKGTEAETK